MSGTVSDEYVLVFPADTIASAGSFEGLRFNAMDYLSAIERVASFKPRSTVEMDASFKQVIPYALVVCGSRVLSYRRGAESAEQRLIGTRSVGIGGHVSTHDPSVYRPTCEEAMLREIAEEVRIRGDYQVVRAAVLNDSSDEVGQVHFGVIYVLSLVEPIVWPNEEAIAELRFEDTLELSSAIDNYESWSRICIGNLDRLLTTAATAAQPALPADKTRPDELRLT
ncbi:MAG: hypothetical protein JXA57_04990 [Armatimonadetes bacterium]|nr:hypothetical protein [Armatimonadota bacterium]